MNDLKGTNRIAIKTKDNSKFVIIKGYVEGEDAMILCFPRDSEILVNVRDEDDLIRYDLADDSNLCFVKGIKIEDGIVIIQSDVLTNVVTENCSDDPFEPDLYVSVFEPEEKTVGFTTFVPIKKVKNIYVDPIYFTELLNSGVVEAEDAVLRKYDISPKFIVYDFKNKIKKYVNSKR